ncbi:MAG: restriction endonuclease [Elusimicrobiota bacterium]|jgi:hypothetical protein|nr:restriction endonuclease [Elusimicrobiota bacterium]
MNNKIEKLIDEAVAKIIERSGSPEKIKKLQEKHNVKIHFIPKRYRIFGGILQSMNIQFGNFIEVLMTLLIENDGHYKIITDYSGKKNNSFELSSKNDALIDNYITRCQTENINLDIEFPKLLKNIVLNKDGQTIKFNHDIDLLFKNIKTDKFYYMECKYNDDHDTGKFVDINRKFIKTYAYLVKELNIENSDELMPILFFFTNKKMKENDYIPEKSNIYRGKTFFEKFLKIEYAEIDKYLLNLSENPKTIKSFKNLYDKIINI